MDNTDELILLRAIANASLGLMRAHTVAMERTLCTALRDWDGWKLNEFRPFANYNPDISTRGEVVSPITRNHFADCVCPECSSRPG